MRELLRNWTPAEIADLPAQELQRAILFAMAERARTPTDDMANRHQPAAEVINHAAIHGNLPYKERQELGERLERNLRRAFDTLERDLLIEPGMNGTSGPHAPHAHPHAAGPGSAMGNPADTQRGARYSAD